MEFVRLGLMADRSDPIKQAALKAHRQLAGKLVIANKTALNTALKLKTFYTPGVGAVAAYLTKHPQAAAQYTGLNNSVAVISDGSAVLGLGNIGPLGALPVMEGKAMLFKQFANIDAFPIVLSTQEPARVIATVEAMAPSFGAINLEDFAAPHCFVIEEHLKRSLPIPVMHDDQHGTAVVVLAGLINALRVVGKNLDQVRIVITGAGAAGSAVTKIVANYSRAEILILDSRGIIHRQRSHLDSHKAELARLTNPRQLHGQITQAIQGADVVIGVSQPDAFKAAHIKLMAERPIVFALANPQPEVLPAQARAAGAKVIATGRSDFANQINNALAFPGIFRGALDNRVNAITEQHKLKAAEALASLVSKPTATKIIPSLFDRRIVPAIAKVIT